MKEPEDEKSASKVPLWDGRPENFQHGSNSHPAWVPGDINLADSLTKNTAEALKTMMMYHRRKCWILKFDSEFISARKQAKLRRQKADQTSIFANSNPWKAMRIFTSTSLSAAHQSSCFTMFQLFISEFNDVIASLDRICSCSSLSRCRRMLL